MKTVICKLISKLVFFVDNLTRQLICWLADCYCVLTQVLARVKNKVSLIWCVIYSCDTLFIWEWVKSVTLHYFRHVSWSIHPLDRSRSIAGPAASLESLFNLTCMFLRCFAQQDSSRPLDLNLGPSCCEVTEVTTLTLKQIGLNCHQALFWWGV